MSDESLVENDNENENDKQREAVRAYRTWVLQLSVKTSNTAAPGDSANPATVMVSRQDAINAFIRLHPELEPHRSDFQKEFSSLSAFYFFPDSWDQQKPSG